MPSPTSAPATLRPDLASSFEEFDLEMNRRNYIGLEVFPSLDVRKKSGTFGKIPLEQLLQNAETKRAPGGGYNRGNWTFGEASFNTEEHGWEEPIDDSEEEMYRDFFEAEQVSTARAFNFVLGNQEQRIAAAVFNATTWTGASLTTAITDEWDDLANAVPLTDVEAAARKVWDGSGLWPNALIINRHVFRNLRRCAQIIDLIKYQGFQDVTPSKIGPQALASLFDLDFVIVAGGAKNTANEGQAPVISNVWSNEYAMLCRVATTNDPKEPCIGRTFHWADDGSQIDGRVESYRDEPKRSDIIRVRHQVDEVVLYTEAGHLISNVTT